MFKDRTGQEWKIDLTIGTVMRLHNSSGGKFDLYDPAKDIDGQPLQMRLAADLVLFWELLWLIVEPEAIARHIDGEQFGQLMAADCLIDAQSAFFGEWQSFFRKLQRPDGVKSLEMQTKVLSLARVKVEQRLQAINQTEIDATIEKVIDSAVNEQFGNVLDSLDAIRDSLPGDNST